jgi:hypothetical protein
MEQEVRFFFNNSNEDRYLKDWDITVPADGIKQSLSFRQNVSRPK